MVLITNVENTDMGSDFVVVRFFKNYFWEDKFSSDHVVFEGPFSYVCGGNSLEFVHIALE